MAGIQSLESIDTRRALRAYAIVAAVAGFVLAGWGQVWFGSDLPGIPWGKAVVIRMSGAVMMAAGFWAMALAAGDPPSRRHGLSWFIAAHAVVWLMLVAQIAGPLQSPIAAQASWALLAVIAGLVYMRVPPPSSLPDPFSSPPAAQQSALLQAARSRYEQQIRDTAAQEERNRLARDLHDAIKQQIFAIQTSAATAEARLDADRAGAREAMAQVRQSAREAMAEMEAMLDQLRVVPLENAGLVEAIKKQCEALAFRTGAEVDVRLDPLPPSDAFEPGVHQAIFRVVQEALANVGRHARARHVSVSLDATAGRLQIVVQDDGIGFESSRITRGMGIQNMRARATEINGTIELHPGPGGGTAVTLSVPYETPDDLRLVRKRALVMAVVFGLSSAIGVARLVMHGFGFANVLVVFFTLAFIQNLLTYWRLRARARSWRVAPPDSAS